MRKTISSISALVLACTLLSCSEKTVEYGHGELTVHIEQGSAWKHDFPLFLGIKVKNTPQIAVWTEDMEGNYLSTVYVTKKTATQGWQMANGNRRKEALPVWSHARGIRYDDGLYMPTSEQPLPDGISGATPHGSFTVRLTPGNGLEKFIVKIEINHSTDFNSYYPQSAKEGDAGYSGGPEGSGQPAIVYQAIVDLTKGKTTFEVTLAGHASPDGSDGEIYTDMSGLTSALEIVKRITVSIPASTDGQQPKDTGIRKNRG